MLGVILPSVIMLGVILRSVIAPILLSLVCLDAVLVDFPELEVYSRMAILGSMLKNFLRL